MKKISSLKCSFLEKAFIFAIPKREHKLFTHAEVAQLVEHNLAKVGVAGSNLVFCSEKFQALWFGFFFAGIFRQDALVVELVDTQDLKSCGQQCPCGFKSRLGHTR